MAASRGAAVLAGRDVDDRLCRRPGESRPSCTPEPRAVWPRERRRRTDVDQHHEHSDRQIWALAIDPINHVHRVTPALPALSCAAETAARPGRPSGSTAPSVTSLVIDPTAPSDNLCRHDQGPSSHGVSKSIDGGDHWTDIGMGTNVWSLGISRSLPSTIMRERLRRVQDHDRRYRRVDACQHRTAKPRVGAGRGSDGSIDCLCRHRTVSSRPPREAISGFRYSAANPRPLSSPPAHITPYMSHRPTASPSVSDGGARPGRTGGPGGPIYALAVDPLRADDRLRRWHRATGRIRRRFSPDGSALEYSTYLGGTGFDYGNAIAVDSAGSAYLVGATTSVNLPVLNPLQAKFGGIRDLFVAKISPAGALTYATYLGGSA